MKRGPIEIYHKRTITDQGTWSFDTIQFKVYGLLAEGRMLAAEMIETAEVLLREDVLARVEAMGDSNGLGFVIVHPGDLGLSIAAHWWIQGSVLCQHLYRRQYDDLEPLDTANRPVVACVWELEIINAEREIWRDTMMKMQPDHIAYLNIRASQFVS